METMGDSSIGTPHNSKAVCGARNLRFLPRIELVLVRGDSDCLHEGCGVMANMVVSKATAWGSRSLHPCATPFVKDICCSSCSKLSCSVEVYVRSFNQRLIRLWRTMERAPDYGSGG